MRLQNIYKQTIKAFFPFSVGFLLLFYKKASNFIIKNYLLADDLALALNQSNVIISRSGYSTIMDLLALGKKAFFIPTPGQNEQEYLAEICEKKGIAPFSTQQDFSLNDLEKLENYNGFKAIETTLDFRLFQLF